MPRQRWSRSPRPLICLLGPSTATSVSKDGVLAARGSDVVVATAERLPEDASIEEIVRRLVNELGTSVEGEPMALVFGVIRDEPQLSDRVAVWRKQWSEQLAHELASRDGPSEPSITQRVNATVAIHLTGLILDEWFLRHPKHDLQLLTDEIIETLHEELAS